MNKQLENKIDHFKNDPVFSTLSNKHKDFIKIKSDKFNFSFQEIKQIIDIATDLEMWQEGDLSAIWNEEETDKLNGKNLRQKLIKRVIEKWESLKQTSKDYTSFGSMGDASLNMTGCSSCSSVSCRTGIGG